ncbi:MAG: D-2-hydroxyacid dehydrogenase family protein [Actinobacteria bacterium]|nr:D-2-hydroxyacid dehydrogenase family protein [Actinomycetota bacterium]
MTRVAVLDDYQGVARSIVPWPDGVDVTAFTDHAPDEAEVVRRLQGFDVVVAMRERTAFPRSVLERLPDLKLLVTTGPRNAAIDVAAANERGVTVSGTWGIVSNTVELTWALMLAVVRGLPDEVAAVRSGGWQQGLGRDLNGKTLGVLGVGNIGSQVAHIAQAFGMGVIAWSQNLTDERAEGVGAKRVEKEDLFRRADIVTVHLVLSDRTRGLIGRDELALMKPTAFLINTSRGAVVDEPALYEALRAGRLAGAGLDVFEQEPIADDNPLLQMENVIVTPHTAVYSRKAIELNRTQPFDEVARVLGGQYPRGLVNRGLKETLKLREPVA